MDSDVIEEVAARWVAKRHSGAWTPVDQAQLDEWLEAATAHQIQYIRIENTWSQSARLQALGAGIGAGVIPPRHSWGDARFSRGTSVDAHPALKADSDSPKVGAVEHVTLRRRHSRMKFFAAAAGIVAMAAGAYLYNSGYFTGDRYTTPVGGMRNVALNDGSRVTLNTDTSLRTALAEHERLIHLDKGEAFFEVAKDQARPFVVDAGVRRVIALGTKFSVRRYGDEVQVVVTEGLVKLVDRGAGHEGPLLAAGAVARTVHSEVRVRPDGGAEIEKLLSWRSGYVNFQEVALADAVAEFNRYNTRKIVIEDPSIATIPMSGNFRANNIEAFLWLVQSGFPIAVHERGDKMILKAK